MAFGAKRLYDRLRKVLICEEALPRWNRERRVFVSEIAGVRQAGEDVLPRQARVVGEDVALRPVFQPGSWDRRRCAPAAALPQSTVSLARAVAAVLRGDGQGRSCSIRTS